MKSVFFGTSAFAVPSLEQAASQTDVVAVVTQPDRPSGRGHRLAPTPVKAAALALGLTVYEPLRLVAFGPQLAALEPDSFVVASYGRILPQAILDLARSGVAFNVHPSLLPLYRGATPLQSAIRDGRTQTGVTIIAMDAGMDTGDILLQEATPIAPGETYGELHDRLALHGATLLGQAIGRLAGGNLERIPQSKVGVSLSDIDATLTRPLAKEDMSFEWSWPAALIVNTVRALAPVPAARAVVDDLPVKVHAARLAGPAEQGATPDTGFVYAAGDGQGVVILSVTPPNRGTMSGAAFAQMRTPA